MYTLLCARGEICSGIILRRFLYNTLHYEIERAKRQGNNIMYRTGRLFVYIYKGNVHFKINGIYFETVYCATFSDTVSVHYRFAIFKRENIPRIASASL